MGGRCKCLEIKTMTENRGKAWRGDCDSIYFICYNLAKYLNRNQTPPESDNEYYVLDFAQNN